jgi:NAD-dependent aldehyde dehydrogenases
VKKELFERLAFYIEAVFGKNIRESQFYPRIVNRQAMERLTAYLGDGKVVFGAQFDMDERYIAPTLLDEVKFDSPVMQEEIFGPILPAITFTDIDEVVRYVNQHEKPLAFYYFGDESSGWKVFGQTTSGGGCINDTLMHIVNHQLPFGGVGNSGLGKYHGRESFLAFSNRRAVVSTPTWIDLPFKYVPFKYFGFVKKLLG